jgi:hypothetical protein
MTTEDASALADRIAAIVRSRQGTSFAELSQMIPEHFHDGDQALLAGQNMVIWLGVSDVAIAAINKLKAEDRVVANPASVFGLCHRRRDAHPAAREAEQGVPQAALAAGRSLLAQCGPRKERTEMTVAPAVESFANVPDLADADRAAAPIIAKYAEDGWTPPLGIRGVPLVWLHKDGSWGWLHAGHESHWPDPNNYWWEARRIARSAAFWVGSCT